LKGYLKIINIRQGSEPYLNRVVRKVGNDDIDGDDGGRGVGGGNRGGDDGNDDDDDDDDDKKFPTHTY
jgi:hypothetical protein